MLEMQASLFMLSSCDIQMLQNSFRFAFLSFKRTNGTHLLVPVGFYSFFEHFPLFCFPFLGMARFLRLLKSRKAIVITINQVIKQYIEHQKECFSRFPNMPWSRSRKRCALELLLSSVACFALFFFYFLAVSLTLTLLWKTDIASSMIQNSWGNLKIKGMGIKRLVILFTFTTFYYSLQNLPLARKLSSKWQHLSFRRTKHSSRRCR